MVVVSGGWSAEAAAAADAIATPGSAEWLGALGAREHVTMTADGHGASRQTWCQCPERPELWVRYEGWTARGREAHGFVCGSCRKLTQVG